MRDAIQLFTLREYGTSTADRVELAAEAGFGAVELAGLPPDAHLDAVADALDDGGLDVAAAHVDAETLETEPDVVGDVADLLGFDRVVVPFLPASAFASAAAVEQAAARLTTLAEALSAHGLALSYHNHDHEFVDLGEETAFDRLLAETGDEVGIELDVGWADAGGADATALLRRLDGRAHLIHVKDVRAGTPVQLGEGNVDFGPAVEAADEVGVEWAVYEHDEPDDPAEAADVGRRRLAELLDGRRD